MLVLEFTRFTCWFDDFFRKSWNWSRTGPPSLSRYSQNTGSTSYFILYTIVTSYHMIHKLHIICTNIYWTREKLQFVKWPFRNMWRVYIIWIGSKWGHFEFDIRFSHRMYQVILTPWHKTAMAWRFHWNVEKTGLLGRVTILYGLIVMEKNSTNPTQGIILT